MLACAARSKVQSEKASIMYLKCSLMSAISGQIGYIAYRQYKPIEVIFLPIIYEY